MTKEPMSVELGATETKKCFFCERPALDGHLTCGRLECPEGAAREIDRARWVADRFKELISYSCPRCGRTSYNPNDRRERYCGACHRFEDECAP